MLKLTKEVNMKKNIFIISIVLVFVIVFYLNFSKEEKTESVLNTDISVSETKVKKEVEKKVEDNTQKTKTETKTAVQTQKQNTVSEKEEYQGVDGDKEKRVIKPYDLSTLPPEPDSELVKTVFVDVNNNKVRDDIEIAIAEEFEDDAELVESYFADSRVLEYDLYLARNEMFDRESVKGHMKNITFSVRCNDRMYRDSYAKELEWNSFDMANLLVVSKVFNTRSKKKLREKLSFASHGFAGGGFTPTYSECKEFFEYTKQLPIGG